MSAPARDEVKARIRLAFEAGTPPDPDGVTMHRPCDECEDVAARLGGKHWTEVTPAVLRTVTDGLPLLSRAAFRHYLPAFMTHALDDPREAAGGYGLVLALKPRRGTDFEARVQGFTKEQGEAIAAFLEWQLEEERADHADEKRDSWFTKGIAYWKAR
jgi:hypothetical protein